MERKKEPIETEPEGLLVALGTDGRLGLAVAEAALRRGGRVVCTATSRSAGTAVDALRNVVGAEDRLAFVAATGDCEADVESLFEVTANTLPAFNALFVETSCGALPMTGRSFMGTSLNDWRAGVEAGLHRLFLFTRYAVSEFLAAGDGGRIVHACSGTSTQPGLGGEVFQTALRSFVRSVAKEYGRRSIACNAILQSSAVTPAIPPAEDTSDVEDAEAMAQIALFLISAEASFINGEVVAVGDGGAP